MLMPLSDSLAELTRHGDQTTCSVSPSGTKLGWPSRTWGLALRRKAIDALKRRLKGEEVTHETSGMSKGDWLEFVEVLG